jgi:hypothetical protein
MTLDLVVRSARLDGFDIPASRLYCQVVPLRVVISSALCVAVFLTGALGLNRGMVLRLDEHGHVELEAAHDLHAQAHEDGAGHDSDDHPTDADHASLHDAIAKCAEAGTGDMKQRTAADGLASHLDAVAPYHLASLLTVPRLSAPSSGIAAGHFRGSTARVERIALAATVLLI